MFYPAKQRGGCWPLRQCCGCCPHGAGIITLGVFMALSFIIIIPFDTGMNDAMSEDLCSKSIMGSTRNDAVDAMKAVYGFYFFAVILILVLSPLFIMLGCIACQLKGKVAVDEGGCCGKKTGMCIGQISCGCIILEGIVVFILGCVMMGMADDAALGQCCNQLYYEQQEGNIPLTTLDSIDSEGEKRLEACGFEDDGSEWPYGLLIPGLICDTDDLLDNKYVFGCAKMDDEVTSSSTKFGYLVGGIIWLLVSVIATPFCAAFVYSATYEISEAGSTGSTGGSATVGQV